MVGKYLVYSCLLLTALEEEPESEDEDEDKVQNMVKRPAGVTLAKVPLVSI